MLIIEDTEKYKGKKTLVNLLSTLRVVRISMEK